MRCQHPRLSWDILFGKAICPDCDAKIVAYNEWPHPEEGRSADGFAVVMDDKASAPKGYWFVGVWNDLDTAENIAAKQGKGVRIEPMCFMNKEKVDCGAPGGCEHPKCDCFSPPQKDQG